MTITNSCKKMMAIVMALAIVLSGLFIAKPASASGGAPSVKVLGATIRLAAGDNNGKQSMRIGIQVDNANQAYACAIQLTVGAKTYTVATKAGYGNTVQEKLHSKDVPNNSVIYAVVLKNIPESAFYSTISILGKAWDINDNLFTSDVAEKNVVGVVNTLQDKFPGLNICIIGGSLYKSAGSAKLSADDLSGYSDDPDPEMTSNPLATPAPTRVPAGPNEWEVPFERFEETGEGQIFYSGGNDHDICAHVYDSYTGDLLCTNETGTQYVDGLVVNLPASEVAKNYRHVTVKYEYLSDSGRFGYKYRDTEGKEYFTFADFSRDGNTTEINIDTACVPVSKFFIITYDTGVSIRLKSIVFSNPAGMPTATPAPTATPEGPLPTKVPYYNVDLSEYSGENGGVSPTVSGGVVTVSLSQYLGIKFTDVPDDADYRYVEIEYTLSGGDVNAYPNTSNNDLNVKLDKPSEFTKLVLPTLSGTSGGVKFFNFGGTATLAIKAITFYLTDPSVSGGDPTPTPAGPTPTPEVPYTADLSQWSEEYGGATVTVDSEGIATVSTGFGGVLFTDVPGAEYKYVVLTYKKSGGDVNAYSDQNTEFKLSNASDYTRVLLSPQRTSADQKVKIFNFGGNVNVYIKSIEFYKNEPSI